jgi:hypothetical protein
MFASTGIIAMTKYDRALLLIANYKDFLEDSVDQKRKFFHL